jgi:hypothetical protein
MAEKGLAVIFVELTHHGPDKCVLAGAVFFGSGLH